MTALMALSPQDAHAPSAGAPPAVRRAADAKGRRPRSRKPPYPNSVLDRQALVACLEKEGLYGTSVQPMHVTAFYKALHRLHYPDLADFVATYDHPQYYRDASAAVAAATPTNENRPPQQPRDSNTKNRNKTQFPRAFLHFLATTDALVTVTSRVARQKTSADGSTTKLAIELHDGQLVESVLMRYTLASAPGSRASLCVSSQCGCAMGCTVRWPLAFYYYLCFYPFAVGGSTIYLGDCLSDAFFYNHGQFCATGTMGLSGNMTTGEILEQVVHADRVLADEYKTLQRNNHLDDGPLPKISLVRNIVFMGMGEVSHWPFARFVATRFVADNTLWLVNFSKFTFATASRQLQQCCRSLPCLDRQPSME